MGLQDILGKFYSIISEMKERGIENAYITVSKNEKEYCESGHYLTEVEFSDVITIIQHENGDIGIVDDGNSGYVFVLNNIKSIMREITDTDNDMVIPKKMFRLLMRNGNIVTMYFDFKTGNDAERLFKDTYEKQLKDKVCAFAEIWYYHNSQVKDIFSENDFVDLARKSSRFVCKTDGKNINSVTYHTVKTLLFKEDKEKCFVYDRLWKDFVKEISMYMKEQITKIVQLA